MDSFEFNKIVASILVALLVGMMGSLIGEALIHPQPLEKSAYVIANVVGVEGEPGAKTIGSETITAIDPLLATADASKGQQIAEKRCSQCHTFKKGEHNKIGPNLWNVVMNHFGHVSAFAFSSALKAKEGKWDFASLNHFLYKPNAFIKGTKMSFAGIKDDKERADVIAFLATLNDTPVSLPTAPNNQEVSAK